MAFGKALVKQGPCTSQAYTGKDSTDDMKPEGGQQFLLIVFVQNFQHQIWSFCLNNHLLAWKLLLCRTTGCSQAISA